MNNVKQKNNKIDLISVLSFILGFFLNQSYQTSVGNISIADSVVIIIPIVFLFKKQLRIPKVILFNYLLFLGIFLFNTIIGLELIWGITPTALTFIKNLIKVSSLVLYLLVGYLLFVSDNIKSLLMGFITLGLITSIIGMIYVFTNISLMKDFFYHSVSRYQGFMNDPNYYSILQLMSIVLILILFPKKVKFQIFSILLLVFSIILSASKTGFLSLLILIIITFIVNILRNKNKNPLKGILIILLFVITIIMFLNFNHLLFDFLESRVPVFSRVSILFSDLTNVFLSSTSARDSILEVAWDIIKKSYFLGVGPNNYYAISKEFYGVTSITHNTYMQLISEWGLFLTILLFMYTFKMLNTIRINNKNRYYDYLLLLMPVLLGSWAISLINARIFWVVLGLLLGEYFKNKEIRSFDYE